jgi:dipeptidyl aminopeptidase/acylaminoacyl peptidase
MEKVPSRLLVFPDEGHWVLHPQNSLLWYQTVLDWLSTYEKATNDKQGPTN